MSAANATGETGTEKAMATSLESLSREKLLELRARIVAPKACATKSDLKIQAEI